MPSITSLELANSRIDLSDVLSWRIAQSPSFIQLFSAVTDGGEQGSLVATSTEHKWLEGVEAPKTKAFTAAEVATGGLVKLTVASVTGWDAGDRVHILGIPTPLRINTVEGTTINATPACLDHAGTADELTAAIATVASGGTLIFDSRPIQEGSTSGESVFLQSGQASNYTQIFRADVDLTATAIAVGQYGNENNVTRQVQFAMDTILRRMNSALLFGMKTQRTASEPGALGGLYCFGTQADGLAVKQESSPILSLSTLNQAAQLITEAGGLPDLVLCGAGQAQVLSAISAKNHQIYTAREDNTIGRYVTQFVTSAGGHVLRIFIDPMIPDTDVWVIDSRGFALVPLNGRALHTEPATTPGTDGVRAMVIGEYTAEFKNSKQSLCRISGLKPSAEALPTLD